MCVMLVLVFFVLVSFVLNLGLGVMCAAGATCAGVCIAGVCGVPPWCCCYLFWSLLCKCFVRVVLVLYVQVFALLVFVVSYHGAIGRSPSLKLPPWLHGAILTGRLCLLSFTFVCSHH